MAKRVSRKTVGKEKVRAKRRTRIRAKVDGVSDKPRLSIFRSNRNLFTQLIDDVKGMTIASASTLDEELKGKAKLTLEGAKMVGALIAKRALAKNINQVVFDRGGYLYHGRVKALADGAREAGLKF